MSARPTIAKVTALTALLGLALPLPLAAQDSDHLITSEAPIVNRNAMQAEQRALADAFRQATERVFADLMKEAGAEGQPLSPGLAQLKASLASKGQRFVMTAGVPFGTPGSTNILRVAWVE